MSACAEPVSWGGDGGTNILVLEMLEQLQFSVGPLCQDGSAEGLHYLLDGDILAGELVSCRTVSREHLLDPSTSLPAGNRRVPRRGTTHQTRPKAPIPTGCRSEYLEVISKVVPKICARTNSAMMDEAVISDKEGLLLLLGGRDDY